MQMKFLKRLFRKKKKKDFIDDNQNISERYNQAQQIKLSSKLEESIKLLEQVAGNSYDISIRNFMAGKQVPAAIIYLDGMIDGRTLQEILRFLMTESPMMEDSANRKQIFKEAPDHLVIVDEIREVDNLADLFSGISSGDTALLFDGTPKALICDTKGWEKRSVVEPDAELTIRGPREGFVENLRTNTSLIRRRIRVPHLWIENTVIGHLTQTDVAFAYIKGLATEDLVNEVRTRLQRIEIDGILESGYIEDFIADTPYTIFPLAYRTERPDKVCAALLEGRVVIITNGTPHVLIVPTEISMLMQAPDDYYESPPIGTFIRLLRYFALLLSLLLPAFYVSVINFHQELLPTDLLLRVTAAREGVPFPVIVEMLIMEVLFEVLREAGIRLPAAIGPAISIVGALILGDAAIRAGLVSPAVVIIVALTAIAGFTTPIFSLGISFRMLRFGFTLLGAIFGLFGVQFFLLLTVVHLASLRSFGVPYLKPFAPFVLSDMKDNIIRIWWWGMRTRPMFSGGREPVRQASQQMPQPGKDPEKTGEEN